MIKMLKNQYLLVFQMLETLLKEVSEETYIKKVGGYFFWQQILHALMGSHFWFRSSNEPFVEPYLDRGYFPELEKEAKNVMTKDELLEFSRQVRLQVDEYFNTRDDKWLSDKSVLYSKLTNLEIITMQIRHLMYHTGYCSALMNIEEDYKLEWIDYFGN
ncbi:DinB family protein [Mycoplasmatota bacterium zrk1]